MRAWKIIVFLLLLGWLIFVGPPASWSGYDRVLWPYLGPFIVGIMRLFILPGHWLLSLVWSGFFDLSFPQFVYEAGWGSRAIAVFAWTFTFVFSWQFWVTVLSRFWKFIGRGNPFGPG